MPMSGLAKRSLMSMSWAAQLGVALVGVALALLVRWMVDGGASGVEMATFFPVIVLSALIMRWQIAAATAFLSLVAAFVFLMDQHQASPIDAILLLTYLITIGLIIAMGQTLQRMVRELQVQKDRAEQFNIELQHRVKNVLQMVKALASRASKADDPAAFYRALDGRIDALVRANQILGVTRHRSGPLSQVVAAALEPFPDHFDLEGIDCNIRGDIGITLTMLLHELATNALKYGALSTDEGRVHLNWQQTGDEIVLDWREAGGPPVSPPEQRGIGTRLLTSHGGIRNVGLDFDPAGLRCRMVVPCENAAA